MKAYLRLRGELCPERKLSAVSNLPSELSSRLSASCYYLLAKLWLISKTQYLIPFLFLVFVSCGAALAQGPVEHTALAAKAETEITPLKIGDKIPDELWDLPLQVVNHPEGKEIITLNDYRDKELIILDFWSSWCSSCINSFPLLDDIQRTYSDNLQILLINPASSKDDSSRILYVMKKKGESNLNSFSVPSVFQDEVITNHFRPKVYPRLIWLNNDGVVLAITGKSEFNIGKLQQVLKKKGEPHK